MLLKNFNIQLFQFYNYTLLKVLLINTPQYTIKILFPFIFKNVATRNSKLHMWF